MANTHSIAAFIEANYHEYWGYHNYPANQCACIRKVEDEWGILGNFAQSSLEVGGVKFNCVEQLYQMMKFKDAAILKDLHGLKGMGVKMKAKHYETDHRREDWGSMLVDALKFCLVKKYEQCPEFRKALQQTKERGLYIVEDQSSRQKKKPDAWGVKPNGDKYTGPNLLGVLLMELRDGEGKLEYRLPADALEFVKKLL